MRLTADDAELGRLARMFQGEADRIGEAVYLIDSMKPAMPHVEPSRSPCGVCASQADEWDKANAVLVLMPRGE